LPRFYQKFNIKEESIMTYCGKCGAQVQDGVKFCQGCGAAVETKVENNAQQAQPASQPPQNDFSQKIQNLNNTADTTAEFDAQDITSNKAMAILAYFGPLVLIPIFAAKQSKFARYHSNQGLVLLIASILYGIAYSILSSIILAISWRLYFIVSIIGLVSIVITILAIIGIINAATGKAKELPLIGKFKILK